MNTKTKQLILVITLSVISLVAEYEDIVAKYADLEEKYKKEQEANKDIAAELEEIKAEMEKIKEESKPVPKADAAKPSTSPKKPEQTPASTEAPESSDVPDTPASTGTVFQLTAYTWTGNPMANGQMPYVGACASNYFPLGTVLYIEGYGRYTVCDRGGMASNVIDIYMSSYDECIKFGRRSAVVTVVR